MTPRAMLRTCAAAAESDGRGVRLPRADRALPHARSARGRRRRLARRRIRPPAVPIGRARTYGDGTDLTILTFGNGLRMSLRVARTTRHRLGIRARVVDLRGWRRCRWRT